jgi:hypothetical protein
MEERHYDVFISYASEDKRDAAEPIAAKLDTRGFRVWIDIRQIRLGDRVPVQINEGIRLSRYGVAILSTHYFAKRWPVDELEALLARENDRTVVLPVRHRLSQEEVRRHHPILATKANISTDEGIDNVVEQIASVVGRPAAEPSRPPAAADFIWVRLFGGDHPEKQQPWIEVRERVFRRTFERAADPVFDLMVANNSHETAVLLKVGIRMLRRTPGSGGIHGYPETVDIQASLRVDCPDDWKRFNLAKDRTWTYLPQPIEMKNDDSPFRFTLQLENFCDVDNASTSELRFYLETAKGTIESETITLVQ